MYINYLQFYKVQVFFETPPGDDIIKGRFVVQLFIFSGFCMHQRDKQESQSI